MSVTGTKQIMAAFKTGHTYSLVTQMPPQMPNTAPMYVTAWAYTQVLTGCLGINYLGMHELIGCLCKHELGIHA